MIYGPCLEKSPGAQIGSTGYSSAPGVQKFDSTWSGDIALEIFVGAIPCSRCFCGLVVLNFGKVDFVLRVLRKISVMILFLNVVVCCSSFCYIYCRFVKIAVLQT